MDFEQPKMNCPKCNKDIAASEIRSLRMKVAEVEASRDVNCALLSQCRPVVEAVREIQELRRKESATTNNEESERLWNEIGNREDELAQMTLPTLPEAK